VSSKYVTFCTICKRDDVGVIQNWNRWQADQSDEWRVARHAAGRFRRGVPSTICGGTGICVQREAVFPREVSA
jgi:hypothetical protein